MRSAVSLGLLATLAGCATAPAVQAPLANAPAPAIEGGAAPAPDSARWLYGSGEAAGASIQAWRQLADYAIATAKSPPPVSVPMGLPDAANGIGTASCTGKPVAVVFDADETVILNRGFAYWQSRSGADYRQSDWDAWERTGAAQVAPVPGAVTGIRRLREAGITVVFNTNRNASHAAETIDALEKAGLGRAVHGETLFLRGDDATGSRKDTRRATIASRYCVIALAGDNLGDFADALNAADLGVQQRRELVARGDYAQLWGAGWFALPNPSYGHWQRGTIDDVFPPDARWNLETAPSEAPAIMNEGN